MDQAKAGAFIAQLRKEAGLTQEQLGQKLGVTNKTVSRWERGNYMPDLDCCLQLSEAFGVTINEILCGQRLSDSDMRQTANQVITDAVRAEAFSVKERTRYWKTKWRKDHWGLLAGLLALVIALMAAVCLRPGVPDASRAAEAGLVALAGIFLYGWQNNRMMIYVEEKLYGKQKPEP